MKRSIKTKVSIIVSLVLLLSFGIYIAVSTVYNSQMYMPKIEKEMSLTVALNLEKINKQTGMIREKANDIAYASSVFQSAKASCPAVDMDKSIESYLKESISSLPEALGNGIWYEPFEFKKDSKYYGPYAYWDNKNIIFTMDYSNAEYDYPKWDWYTMGIPADWDRSVRRPKDWYYSAPYVDSILGTIITTESVIYDQNSKIIGTTTVDWQLKSLLDFLENTKVTEDSYSFLADSTGLIMANTMDKNIVMKDKKEAAYISSLNSPVKGMIKNQDMLVNGIKYRVYYTITDADMIYGILVPVSTIEQPVVRYAILNVAMAAVLALVLLVVLNLVLGTTLNQVRKLTDAGNKIADGNIDVEIPALKTGDEIEDLSGTMTMLVGALKFLKKENEEKQKPGKKK